LFDAFLIDLRKAGVDTDRLLLWFGSIHEDAGPSSGVDGWSRFWTQGLASLAGKHGGGPRNIVADSLATLMQSYQQEVAEPFADALTRARQLGSTFLSGPEGRTEWDEELWRLFFSRVDISPQPYIVPCIERGLHRTWWRKHGAAMPQADKDALLATVCEAVQNGPQADIVDWSMAQSADEAFAMGRAPDFERWRRDWPTTRLQ
jgi:hypothetical protein